MKSLNSFEGLNKTTFLSEIIFLSLVLGFRPTLDFFSLILKVPNLESLSFLGYWKKMMKKYEVRYYRNENE